jgi:hypothetical protein
MDHGTVALIWGQPSYLLQYINHARLPIYTMYYLNSGCFFVVANEIVYMYTGVAAVQYRTHNTCTTLATLFEASYFFSNEIGSSYEFIFLAGTNT